MDSENGARNEVAGSADGRELFWKAQRGEMRVFKIQHCFDELRKYHTPLYILDIRVTSDDKRVFLILIIMPRRILSSIWLKLKWGPNTVNRRRLATEKLSDINDESRAH